MQQLTKFQTHALRFAMRYPGWHTYAQDSTTKLTIISLASHGLVSLNQFNQFRINRGGL